MKRILMNVSTEHSKKLEDSFPSLSYSNSQAQDSFIQAVENFEGGNFRSAIYHFDRVFGLVELQGPKDLLIQISMCLGLSNAAIGEHKAALKWLDFTQSQQGLSTEGIWTEKLSRLVDLLQLLISTRDIETKFSEILSRLQGDASTINEELTNVWQQVHSMLMESPTLMHRSIINEIQEDKQLDFSVTPKLLVRLLGHFEAYYPDDTPLILGPHCKSQDLFKLMTTDPGTRFYKEQLHAIFWADEEPSLATGKLHTAVSRLRGSLNQAGLGKDALLFEDGYYYLNECIDVHSDLAQFEAHNEAGSRLEATGETELAIVEYESAIALYRGKYLQELVCEDWLLPRRALIEQEFLELLCQISNCYYICEHYVAAAEYCRRILSYDNFREDVYRRLMRCLNHQGKRNQAIRIYKDLQEVLKKELGVEPMHRTKELIKLLKEE